jgi:hypothetical protein
MNMKINTTPIARLRELVTEYLKKNQNDDETATMLAIKPKLAQELSPQAAEHLLSGRLYLDCFSQIRAMQFHADPPAVDMPAVENQNPPDFV